MNWAGISSLGLLGVYVPYKSQDSVANSYDQWTLDGILEFYWGEHIHLGHYGNPPQAKIDFVHEMVKWGNLPRLLDHWSHPQFASVEENLQSTGLVEGEVTMATLPSWLDSIWQGLVKFGAVGFIKSLREAPALLLMRLAFGMFRALRKVSN